MQNLDMLKEKIVKCYHCGNETKMPQMGEFAWDSHTDGYHDFDFHFTYKMFACPVCHNITRLMATIV